MIWLVSAVLMLQTFFYWILKPAIAVTTPIFEMRGLGWLLLLVGAWLLSGRGTNEGDFK